VTAAIDAQGTSPGNRLVEYVEYPGEVHPYLVATQAHPELSSRPTRPHPLFVGLVRAVVDRITTIRCTVIPAHQ
jgi:CTP synthase